MKAVTIKPVEGRLVLMPDRSFAPVPAEGTKVYLDAFYTKAIQSGDLAVVPDEPPTKAYSYKRRSVEVPTDGESGV